MSTGTIMERMAGLELSGRSLELLTALHTEDKSVTVNILIEVHLQCKLCQASAPACKSEKLEHSPKSWITLEEIKEHMSTQHRQEASSSIFEPERLRTEHYSAEDAASTDTSTVMNVAGGFGNSPKQKKRCGLQKRPGRTSQTHRVRGRATPKLFHTSGKHGSGKSSELIQPQNADVHAASTCKDTVEGKTMTEDEESADILDDHVIIDSAAEDKQLMEVDTCIMELHSGNNRTNIRYTDEQGCMPCENLDDGDGSEFSDLSEVEPFTDHTPSSQSQTRVPTLNKTKTCAECQVSVDSVEECVIHFMEKHDYKRKLHVLKAIVPKASVSGDLSQWFTCPLCKKKFKYDTLLKHVVLIHMWRPVAKRRIRKKDHLCALCGKVFHCDQNYYHHLRQVHQGKKRKSSPYKSKQYKCTLCEYTSCEQRRIASHMKYVHSGIKAYSCQHCSYSTWERTSMRSHMYRHQETKKYSCEHCSYQCIQKKQLRGHMLHKHNLQLPKTGSTRLPAKKGPRQIFKPDVELTNRGIGTDPVKSRKSARKRSRTQDGEKPTRASSRKDLAANSKAPVVSSVKVEPTWTVGTPQPTEQYTLQPASSMPYILGSAVQSNQDALQVLANVSSTNPAATHHVPEAVHRVQYAEYPQTVVQSSVVQSGSSLHIGTREVQDSSIHQYQTASLIYQPQGILTAKACPPILQVDQPMTFVSGSLPDPSETYDRAAGPQRLTLDNQVPLGMSTMKSHAQLGETITVTPIYAQTADRINTLNPNNSQGSFIYILK